MLVLVSREEVDEEVEDEEDIDEGAHGVDEIAAATAHSRHAAAPDGRAVDTREGRVRIVRACIHNIRTGVQCAAAACTSARMWCTHHTGMSHVRPLEVEGQGDRHDEDEVDEAHDGRQVPQLPEPRLVMHLPLGLNEPMSTLMDTLGCAPGTTLGGLMIHSLCFSMRKAHTAVRNAALRAVCVRCSEATCSIRSSFVMPLSL